MYQIVFVVRFEKVWAQLVVRSFIAKKRLKMEMWLFVEHVKLADWENIFIPKSLEMLIFRRFIR